MPQDYLKIMKYQFFGLLENCNCEEYGELKEIIEGTKKSKY